MGRLETVVCASPAHVWPVRYLEHHIGSRAATAKALEEYASQAHHGNPRMQVATPKVIGKYSKIHRMPDRSLDPGPFPDIHAESPDQGPGRLILLLRSPGVGYVVVLEPQGQQGAVGELSQREWAEDWPQDPAGVGRSTNFLLLHLGCLSSVKKLRIFNEASIDKKSQETAPGRRAGPIKITKRANLMDEIRSNHPKIRSNGDPTEPGLFVKNLASSITDHSPEFSTQSLVVADDTALQSIFQGFLGTQASGVKLTGPFGSKILVLSACPPPPQVDAWPPAPLVERIDNLDISQFFTDEDWDVIGGGVVPFESLCEGLFGGPTPQVATKETLDPKPQATVGTTDPDDFSKVLADLKTVVVERPKRKLAAAVVVDVCSICSKELGPNRELLDCCGGQIHPNCEGDCVHCGYIPHSDKAIKQRETYHRYLRRSKRRKSTNPKHLRPRRPWRCLHDHAMKNGRHGWLTFQSFRVLLTHMYDEHETTLLTVVTRKGNEYRTTCTTCEETIAWDGAPEIPMAALRHLLTHPKIEKIVGNSALSQEVSFNK